ncbi:MAG: sugar phosphate isomerase/epimerase [Bryobacteraceae bacterium]|nr:sugar phosphate isomerase/epimerase [Bryobacteraceae bacterium]
MTRRALLLAAASRSALKLAIGNYGMPNLAVDEALAAIRRIGYDGAELCLMAGWPSEPAKLDAAARRRIRQQRLPICSLIENFSLLGEQAGILERIRRASGVAHDVRAPLLQTVLGGKPAEWEQVKQRMAENLRIWARVATEHELRIAVKSHIGSASDTPEKLIWLLDQVRSSSLTAVYDYSHFELQKLDLTQTLGTLLPRSAFITVKDGHLVDGQPRFLLPGEGTTDYDLYFRLLKERGYRGWMLVEVSRQLQTAPGFDALAAARRSYAFLAPRIR